MADLLVSEWTEEFEALTESEIHTYAAEQEHNHEVIIALYIVFDEPLICKKDNLLERVCQQLFAFYRSGEHQLRKFVMQYIPSLIYLHLSGPKVYPAVETLLVSLYNLEVIDSTGQPCVKSFRVPSLAQSSIFHDSSNLEQSFVAESSLRRWEECNTKLVNWGPLPQVEALNAQNRQRVVTALVFLYNQQIAAVHIQGVEHSLRAVSKLVSQGFQVGAGGARNSADSDSLVSFSSLPRILMSSPLLLELLHIVYHALERGASGAAQTLHDVTYRATYDTYTDVLLMAHAVSNLLHRSPAAYMPRSSNKSNISKSMITNASFRTKKLPDDIPILDQEEGGGGGVVGGAGDASLDSIVEEGGAEQDKTRRGRSGSSALKHLPKIPGLGKKPKLKSSPTPPRHSLEEAIPPQLMGNSNLSLASSGGGSAGGGMSGNTVPPPPLTSSGGGDQVSLVASSSNGNMQSAGGEHHNSVVHVTTV